MKVHLPDVRAHAKSALLRAGHLDIADRAAEDCMWLEAAGYNGVQMLSEALADAQQSVILEKDVLGLNLHNVSCVFVADAVAKLTLEHGRLFLRNVRHGLYVLPQSVRGNYGIGCPVDPGFPLGGERSKNPYSEKIVIAERDGVEIDAMAWQALTR
jgi:hypothetical protein